MALIRLLIKGLISALISLNYHYCYYYLLLLSLLLLLITTITLLLLYYYYKLAISYYEDRRVSEGYAPPRPYSHSAEKCLRLYIAMVIFTLLYISFDGIKSLSLYDITI
jgi:hypothetical protein